MTVYEKIDRVLSQYERHKYCERSIDSICDYISWAWKWRKITKEQMEECADRACAILDEQVQILKSKGK